ncbi:MAG: helix-turn-helix domain-containing protein [Clostridia bacterium]|nr:helix-turn-helix domain-containing protein [Clostridia bacterium]
MIDSRYEVIDYSGTNFKFLAGYVNYVMPHLHREIELGLVLSGEMGLNLRDGQSPLDAGDIWLIDPFQSHGTCTMTQGEPYLYVGFQLPRAFFREYYPMIDRLEFTDHVLTASQHGEAVMRKIRLLFLKAARAYYKADEHYQLRCAGYINAIFAELLDHCDTHMLDENQVESNVKRNLRMQKINEYIEQNYDRKLLLEEIAESQGLSLHYMSHFFKDNWGMSFQKYLQYFRCEKARELIVSTDMSITDISFVCGFSDSKYLRQGFRELYQLDPSALRQRKKQNLQFDTKSKNICDSRRLTLEEAMEIFDRYIEQEQ